MFSKQLLTSHLGYHQIFSQKHLLEHCAWKEKCCQHLFKNSWKMEYVWEVVSERSLGNTNLVFMRFLSDCAIRYLSTEKCFGFFFSLCTMPSVDMFMSQRCQCEHGINHSITLWSEHFSRMNHIKNLDITATKEHYKKHSFFPQTNEKKNPKVPPFHCPNTYLYQILLIWIWIQFVLNCSGPDCKSVLCEIASLFLYHIYNPNTVSAEKISLFLFSQLVKYHQLHPFDNPLVKGKRQNSNHRQMIL